MKFTSQDNLLYFWLKLKAKLSTVAFSGEYSDLSGKPTSLPANGGNANTVGGKLPSAFATSAQGTKADNALPKAGGTMTGDVSFPDNKPSVRWRKGSVYDSAIGWDYSGNGCMAFMAKNTVSRFRFHAGVDPATFAIDKMMGITPDFEIKKGGSYVSGKKVIVEGDSRLTNVQVSTTQPTNQETNDIWYRPI